MIPLLLAQVPPPTDLASWLQVLMYLGGFVCTLIGGAVGIKMLRSKPQSTPQPLVVSEHQPFVAKNEYEKDRSDLKTELTRHAARRSEIYDEQKLMAVRLATVETETKNQTVTLSEIKDEQRAQRERFDLFSTRLLELLGQLGVAKGNR